jgi:hypothetical protein
MSNLLFILKFFGELILLFVVGGLIGYLLKLDEVYEEMQDKKDSKT